MGYLKNCIISVECVHIWGRLSFKLVQKDPLFMAGQGYLEHCIQFMKWNEYVIEKTENTIKAQTAYWNLVSCEEAMGE